jgi:hypothetical protein
MIYYTTTGVFTHPEHKPAIDEIEARIPGSRQYLSILDGSFYIRRVDKATAPMSI